jgi:hypothetical protein
LESPSSEEEVTTVAAVGIVEIEDRFDRFGRVIDDPVVGDVDPSVGVGGMDLDALWSKGSITDSA